MRDRKHNYGLIYFPISLLGFVVLWRFGCVPQYIVTMGFFAMGYSSEGGSAGGR
jgi:hypothetical protein